MVVIQGDGCDAQVAFISIVGVILCKQSRTPEQCAKPSKQTHQGLKGKLANIVLWTVAELLWQVLGWRNQIPPRDKRT